METNIEIQPKISIAIPVYEMNSSGVSFLDLSLKRICLQSLKEIEVVISDHSKNNDIEKLCKEYSDKLNIVYIKNEEKRGSSSANLNNALKNCKGEIIKILMQDEYLYDINALKKIKDKFDNNKDKQWLLTGCLNGREPDKIMSGMFPVYSNNIVLSQNTIGSPSVMSIRNNNNIEFFNEDLIWIMDCEYYKRMYDKFGSPAIINDYIVFVLQHKDQVTSFLNNEIKTKEEKYLIEKYIHEL